MKKLGRNDPCRCGSGKKYKKCCYNEDQLRMRDASAYSGITKSQLRENPGLVDDASYIADLRPYELKKLAPSKMNDAQLLAAYRRADIFGLREVALEMLSELKSRQGKEELAVEHMFELFDSALTAQDTETIRKLSPHLPEKDRYFSESDRLKHQLLEKPDKLRDLEALCIKAFADNEDHCLLELSYAFEDILPALSIVFGRAAIVSEPERKLDNQILIDAIRKRRITLDLEPWGDPIEDYWDWIMGKDSERIAEEDKDERIEKLQEQLSEAREKSSLALKDLQGKEKALAELEKKLQGVTAVAPLEDVRPIGKPTKNDTMAEEDGEERKQAIVALKSKIEALKMEIRSQQESKLRLRKELHHAHEIISKQRDQKAPSQEMPDSEADFLPPVPEKVRIPDFTTSFRKSCENLPSALVVKAMQAAIGFASRDKAILRQTLGIERMPDYYRVKVGIHHRLIIHQTPGNELQVVELIPRKQLETWIRKHTS
ncbi:MAG: SEC-C domain-containing protein [Nitrospirae bacterium]|nr:SEC-C domain-containing protein [Nitrospirota bacterium]